MPHPATLTILHIAAPGPVGGLESVVLDLTSGLEQAGHRVVLAAVLDAEPGGHPVIRRAADRGVEVRPLVVARRGYVRECRQLREAIKQLGPDVIHTHGYRADLVGGLAARRSGVPWLSTVHGFIGGDRKNRIYEWLQVRSYRRAQAIVAVSGPIQSRLVKDGVPAAHVRLLPNAWAPRPILARDEARHRLGITGRDPVIGWVGRLSREKGADVLLEALAQLPHRRWSASIIGEGRERPALEAQARRLGIANLVQWHGLIPDAAEVYSAFDTWVLSSRTEGMPIALFEALAAGVPAVVTRVGGVPDVVSTNEALLVPSDDARALAAAIDEQLSDAIGGQQRAGQARRRLATVFAPGPWIDAHESLYRTLVLDRSGVA
jgi:glycosyltransferase involved in cell wall biosynthesis